MNKKILLMYTGGTAGMKHKEPNNPESPLVPVSFEEMREYLPTNQINQLGIDFVEPVIKIEPKDSSELGCDDWIKFAEGIYSHKDEIDGAVVLHGTDTMHYTASALSFMFQNLPFPVILTGAYSPISEARTDARDNIVAAACIAAGVDNEKAIPVIPEVCIYTFLSNWLHRGNRTIEEGVGGGYASPNYSILGEVGGDIKIYEERLLPKSSDQFMLSTNLERDVLCLPYWGWLTDAFNRMILNEEVKGVIVQKDIRRYEEPSQEFVDSLAKAVEKGKFIGLVSDAQAGGLDASTRFRNKLDEHGIAYGHDMTIPAALAKARYLLGNHNLDKARDLFGKNLRGELTGSLYRES